MINQKNFFGVYVHIPFCDSKCLYCNFVSQCCVDENLKIQYFNAIHKEILADALNVQNNKHSFSYVKNINDNKKTLKKLINSVYFGGGTPSCVDEKYIVNILNLLKTKFCFASNAEISIECNPCSVNRKKLLDLKNAGFNRISIGAQSFFQDELNFLGRKHTVKQIFDAVKIAKSVGFENISLDLIVGSSFNIDYKKLENEIIKAKNAGVKHFSVYMLTLEKNTPLFELVQNGLKKLPDDDIVIRQFNYIQKILRKHGFLKYEVSNFANKGYECKHNLNYWQLGNYIAYGVAGCSFIDDARSYLTYDIKKYVDIIEKGVKKEDYTFDYLSLETKDLEYIMLGLRLTKGIELNKIKTINLQNKKSVINELVGLKLIKYKNNKIKLTCEGFSLINQIILKLIS